MLISILPSCKTHPQITVFWIRLNNHSPQQRKMEKKKIYIYIYIYRNPTPKLTDQGKKSVGLTCSGRKQWSTTSWSFVLLFLVTCCHHHWKWSGLNRPKQQSLGFFLHQRGRLTKLGQDGNGRELLLWVWEKRKEESVVRDKLKRVGWDEKWIWPLGGAKAE